MTPQWVIGMMSGTSMDGIDAALIRSDGESVAEFGPFLTRPYDEAFRDRLRRVVTGAAAAEDVEADLTELHADLIRDLLAMTGCPPKADIALIGFHGHTVLHRPEQGITLQIGDGDLLARRTGIDVVAEFRKADVQAGGQGAPFVPAYHAALARRIAGAGGGGGSGQALAFVNIGGVANVTWIGPDGTLLAFDTGPGNALLDDWALEHTGRPVDEGGRLAAAGTADVAVLAQVLGHPYFERPPPKSIDRGDFSTLPVVGLAPADGAATLAELTARSIALAERLVPVPPARWLVCGGGRHNPEIMRRLQMHLAAPVEPVEAAGFRGDAIEAEAFAFLAIRSRRGLPLSYPGTTGVPRPLTGGRLHPAPR